jgi:hypothetical protein
MVRGWYVDNVHHSVPEKTDSQAFYTTEASIVMDAKVGDNVRGFMQLETTMGGDNYTGEFFWGKNGYDQKPDADLRFRQLWIQYTGSGLLGVPAGVKVGHMPITLGEKQFFNNERFGDDAILLWVDPTKELHLAVGTAKLQEGEEYNQTDDLDGYMALLTYALNKDNTIGANWTWIKNDSNAPYDFHNIGLHANGNISGLTYAGEVDFQTGEIADPLKAKGWAAFIKLGYIVDPVNIRGSFAYGSGDDNWYDEDMDEFQALQGPDEIEPISRLVHHTMIYGRWVNTAAVEAFVTTTAGGNTRNTGIANTTLFNLGLDFNAIPNLNLALDGFYLQASETGAWEDIVGASVDEELGWELDFKGTYKIAKNLSYFVEAAGFWPGDFYDDVYGEDETVTQVVHGLLLHF